MHQILIIEDNEINCMIYEKILSNDYTCLDFAYDGQEGIDKFKEKSFDLILLDLGLPKIGGIEVARLIKEYEAAEKRLTKIPIIVITADSTSATRQAALAVGVDEYLTKPFNIDQLQSMVQHYFQEQMKKSKVAHNINL
jgi:CheY-like chemotaxis protein